MSPKAGRLTISSEGTGSTGEQQTGIRRNQRPTTARGHRTKLSKPQSPKE